MSHPVCKKLERALRAYLEGNHQGAGDVLEGMVVYEGHRSGVIEEQDHLVVTAVGAGGDLREHGIYEVTVQVVVRTFSVPQEEEPVEDPAVRHEERHEELVAIFSQAQMGDVVDAINAVSAASGVGVSCYEVGEPEEGRNGQLFVSTVNMVWTAHLVEVEGDDDVDTVVDELGNRVVDEEGNAVLTGVALVSDGEGNRISDGEGNFLSE